VKIHQLSEDIVNKIAAGEVIERPASVVKELVENALDAGATVVDVDVMKAGKELIRVRDNGCGMSVEDAKLCFVRHTTSKIRSADDLHGIRTLGFRGEALSSIAAVSHFVLMTKEKGMLSGTDVVVSGGIVGAMKEVGCADGTCIEVHDLFLNTPVRKKFLKSDTSELGHIVDIVSRYALIHSSVAFTLTHNGNVLFRSAASGMLDSLITLYGADVAKELVPVTAEADGIVITGFISKPTVSRADKTDQSIFVNGRLVSSPLIQHALHEAYHSTLFVHRYPVVALSIVVDPARVDVNVHPTKKEVKFEHGEVIYRFVYHAVKDALMKHNLVPAGVFGVQSTLSDGLPRYTFEAASQTVLQASPALVVREEALEVEYIPSSKLPPLRLLGQIHKTFFAAETPGGMLIIDQHIVQERVLYEKFMRQYMENAVKSQTLLEPEMVEFSAVDAVVLKEYITDLKALGFDLEEFGGNSFLVRSIPMVFGRAQPRELLHDLIQQLVSGKRTSVAQKAEEIITRMSCRYSVKAGDTVVIPQMRSLLAELDTCTLPYHCPHGRPIFILVSIDELEKMFLRR
jgi:DNA mismatch repair protein MutL